ncbi:type II secretion system protein [Sneathiella sp.]|jgi:prepilin-type N-terminal cleavage/methylation domain-containing protein|uniref:type II secretion system protein n=1 Tax=Sneathiella sp. TaxID=1964365 RepID=UPI0025EA6C45|nr:type II secretion system protein [Sneathiella sp.]
MQIGDAQDLFYVSFIAGFAFGFGIFYLLNALSLNIDRGAVWGFLARLWPGRSGSGRGRSPGDGTRGFTLIEMAMVILIAGLLIAGVARAMTIWLQWHAKTVTDEAQAEITEALKTFVAENNRLPCAAPIDAPPNSAEFGRESIEACKDYDPVPGIWMAPVRGRSTPRPLPVPRSKWK